MRNKRTRSKEHNSILKEGMRESAIKPAKEAAEVAGIMDAMPDMKLISTMTPRLTTAAMTCDSVSDEINMPMAISAAPSRKNARRVE